MNTIESNREKYKRRQDAFVRSIYESDDYALLRETLIRKQNRIKEKEEKKKEKNNVYTRFTWTTIFSLIRWIGDGLINLGCNIPNGKSKQR